MDRTRVGAGPSVGRVSRRPDLTRMMTRRRAGSTREPSSHGPPRREEPEREHDADAQERAAHPGRFAVLKRSKDIAKGGVRREERAGKHRARIPQRRCRAEQDGEDGEQLCRPIETQDDAGMMGEAGRDDDHRHRRERDADEEEQRERPGNGSPSTGRKRSREDRHESGQDEAREPRRVDRARVGEGAERLRDGDAARCRHDREPASRTPAKQEGEQGGGYGDRERQSRDGVSHRELGEPDPAEHEERIGQRPRRLPGDAGL